VEATSNVRERALLWAGVVTALLVTAYRVSLAVSPDNSLLARIAPHLLAEGPATNICLLWSLMLFGFSWLLWRNARSRRNELESIIRSVNPDVLVVIDQDRTISLCNPAVTNTFGYQIDEVIGRRTDLLFDDRRSSPDKREVFDALKNTGGHTGTAVGRRKDGTTIPLEIESGLLKHRAGAVLLIHDVTERCRLEKMREDLTNMIVHDLKSPITTIQLCLSMVRKSLGDDLGVAELRHLGRAANNTKRLAAMIGTLLDTNKLESAEMQLRCEPTELGPLIDETIDMFSDLATDKHVTLHAVPRSCTACCDREIISRVLSNLISNALKYTPSGGEVRVLPEPQGEIARISVSDTGPGLAPEHHARIFERYGQVDAREFSTGLGLTFCKLAVEAHGGEIGVQSEEGKGSTFFFSLPSEQELTAAENGPLGVTTSSTH